MITIVIRHTKVLGTDCKPRGVAARDRPGTTTVPSLGVMVPQVRHKHYSDPDS